MGRVRCGRGERRRRLRRSAARIAAYEEALERRDLLDFDDLLLKPLALLRERPDLAERYRERFRWISIDEYQDIDALQYALIRLLAPPGANLCAIGDPDQSIYGFRGADVGFFLRFRRGLPGRPRRPPHPQLPLDLDGGRGRLPGDPAGEPGAGPPAGGGA